MRTQAARDRSAVGLRRRRGFGTRGSYLAEGKSTCRPSHGRLPEEGEHREEDEQRGRREGQQRNEMRRSRADDLPHGQRDQDKQLDGGEDAAQADDGEER